MMLRGVIVRPKVFLTRRLPDKVLEYLHENVDLELNREDRVLSKSELIEGIRGKDALICNLTDHIDAEIMDGHDQLKVIANFAVGFNNIDIKSATERKIWVTNTPGVLTESTADMTWTLMLAISRRIMEGDQMIRSQSWKGWQPMQLLGGDISGSTLGIVGLGRIGLAVVRRAMGFHMNVNYWNRTRLDEVEEKQLGLTYEPLDQLLQKSDFVSLHTAYHQDTHHLIGARELDLMKPTAYIINTARGALIDEKALVQALKKHSIAGAGLDVYENEPAVESELIHLNNVVLAPHLGSATLNTRTKMGIMAVNNVLACFNGMIPPNAVNKIDL
jgi:glyoxylate reductase